MGKRIAVTGGIGSGKSTVIDIIRKKGYPVFSCDIIYAQLLQEKEYIEKLQNLFPETVIKGQIDKTRLSRIIFNDSLSRKKLNDLAHPIIMQRLCEKMDENNSPYTFAEVPLLFEGNFQKDFDGVIVVLRELPQRVEAIMARDKVDEETAYAKIKTQFNYDAPENEKVLKSENIFCISNNQKAECLEKCIDSALLFFKNIR